MRRASSSPLMTECKARCPGNGTSWACSSQPAHQGRAAHRHRQAVSLEPALDDLRVVMPVALDAHQTQRQQRAQLSQGVGHEHVAGWRQANMIDLKAPSDVLIRVVARLL